MPRGSSMATRAAVQARERLRGRAHLAAALLLAIFVAAVTITTFTRSWLGSLPQHQHLVSAGYLLVRHSHPSDTLDRTLTRLVTVETAAADITSLASGGATDGAGLVISYWSAAGAQFEFSSFASSAIATALLARTRSTNGVRLVAADIAGRVSQSLPPLSPPPRSRSAG